MATMMTVQVNRQMQAVASVSKDGTYVFVRPTAMSAITLRELMGTLPEPLLPVVDAAKVTGYHATLMYSNRQPMALDEMLNRIGTPEVFYAQALGIDLFGPNSDVLVLRFESEGLAEYHEQVKQYLSWDSDYDWKPHITLGEVPTDRLNDPALQAWLAQVNDWIRNNPLVFELENPGVDFGKSSY